MASFTVVLNSRPTADVVIDVISLDVTEGTVSTSQLVFNQSNWNVSQTVVVSGVDDTVRDGNVSYTVQVIAARSADSGYNGLDADDVQVTNQDNERGQRSSGDGGGGGGKGGGPKKGPSATDAGDDIGDSGDSLDGSSDSTARGNGRRDGHRGRNNWFAEGPGSPANVSDQAFAAIFGAMDGPGPATIDVAGHQWLADNDSSDSADSVDEQE
jgi:hypothetical protein